MGFRIVNDEVVVDHGTHDFAITTVDSNPVFEKLNDFEVYSAFKRTRVKKPLKGDNCPLIYALKGLDDLTVNRRSIYELSKTFYPIVENFLGHKTDHWDLIIPLPSSSGIGRIVADRVARKAPCLTSHVVNDALCKTTIFDARAELSTMGLPKSAQKTLENKLRAQRHFSNSDWSAPYSLKNVPVKLRHHLKVFKHQNDYNSLNPKNILLVDDVVSSGTSLKQAHELISNKYTDAQVSCFTLFSSFSRDVKAI